MAVKPMQISLDVAAEIVRRAPRECPICLWGDTGLGKSQIIRQIGVVQNIKILTEIAQLRSQIDFMGLPMLESREGKRPKTVFTEPLFLPDPDEHGEVGLFFLDELPNATRSVQAAVQSLLTHNEYNGYIWPKGWKAVVAGNQMGHRANTYEMPRPVRARLMHLYVGPNVDAFTDWGAGAEQEMAKIPDSDLFPSGRDLTTGKSRVHPMIRAFLKRMPEMIFQETEGYEAIACPRTWEYASWVLYLRERGLSPELGGIMLQGLVGPAPYAQLESFLQDVNILPDPEDVLSGNVPVELVTSNGHKATVINGNQLNSGQLYALATGIASRADGDKQFKAVFDIVDKFAMSEHKVLCIRELFLRKREIADLDEFRKFAKQFKDKLPKP